MGKLIVTRVFVDIDLLVDMAKRYDLVTRVLRNYVEERLFFVLAQVIREFFMLNSNIALLEKIDLGKFKSMYEAQKIYLHVGPIQEHFCEDWSAMSSYILHP